jgi:nitrate reductase assembly molybdenum cofactor insertion protein NarJ
MSDIPGISERAPQRPIYVNQVADMAKALGLTEDAQVMAKEIAGLLASQPAVRVTNAAASAATTEVGTPTGATGVPSLDTPDSEVQREVNLEKLISYLQLETDKRQTELAKDRIELQKNELEQRHGEQMAKINESLEQMDKATISNNFTRVFGWLMAAAAVALAVVSCVATGGIAVGAVIGAVMAVGMCVMNETGVTEDLTEALTDALKNAGMSDQAAQILASLTVAVGMIALTLGTGAGGSAIQTALGGTAKAATSVMLSAQSMQGGMRLALGGIGIGTTVAMGVSTSANYKSMELQADTTEMEKFMAVMQQQLEESQEELEKILSQVQNIYSDIAAIINSAIDTETEIAQKMGQMA